VGEKTARSKSRRCLRALSLAEYHFRDIIIYKISAFSKEHLINLYVLQPQIEIFIVMKISF
jgi:hypothetical protein